jgi:hypothetical protein
LALAAFSGYEAMKEKLGLSSARRHTSRIAFAGLVILAFGSLALAQRAAKSSGRDAEEGFGPVMQAYLGYLRNEQEVVDDRVSRSEISPAYYRRNSERIQALRQMAIRIYRETGIDYVPELEAVTADEFGTLFENPPRPGSFRGNQILDNKFRFLSVIRLGEPFYLFARLDPYEQAEHMKRGGGLPRPGATDNPKGTIPASQRVGQTPTRPRRVAAPR